MAAIHSDEFKRDAVRIATRSKDQKTIRGIVFAEDGLTRRQVASDLGIGHSTFGKWVRVFSEEARGPAPDADLLRENDRLRKENRILRDLSRIRKQSGGLFSRRMWEVLKKAAIRPVQLFRGRARNHLAIRFACRADADPSGFRVRWSRLPLSGHGTPGGPQPEF